MGWIEDMWNADPTSISGKKLKQILVLAGDGNINHQATYEELRSFFTKIDLDTMKKFIDECLSEDKADKFDERGFVLQDLVNEIGRRLGYTVTNGLYRGKRNDENGFDGLWKAPDGTYIVMESKTSDAYSINLDALAGYKEELIANKVSTRKKCSVLIVLGRSDKGTVPSLIRGSAYSQEVRLISTTALFELLRTYETSKSTVVQYQIMKLLKPHDYMQLDNLVELVFPQTDENIPNNEETESEDEIIHIASSFDGVIPELPDMELKVGKFIKEAMSNLSSCGYVFTDEQLQNLSSKEWSKQVFNTNWPFIKIHNTNEATCIVDESGRTRYWTGLFTFGDVQFYVTKELFEKDHNKEKFIEWYKSLKADQ